MSNETRILVGSAGTASSINIIKSLKNYSDHSYYIHAIDCDALAPGLFLADSYTLVPPFKDTEHYLNALKELQEKYQFDLFLPTYSRELEFIAANQDLLESIGLTTMLSSFEAISTCNRKKRMNQLVQDLGIQVPKAFSRNDIQAATELTHKLVVKPNTGSSSSGVLISGELEVISKYYEDEETQICQECIEGKEFTVDVFCNRSSEVKVISVRERMSVKAGQVVKSINHNPDRFRTAVTQICKKIGIVGVCNIQFIENDQNQLFFIELNPRFAAGGLMLTTHAGANIPELMVKEALSRPIDKNEYSVRVGVTMTRYWEEIFNDDSH